MKFLLFLLVFSLHAVDYDCIVVGSSPISLFEALYQHATGKKVLVLESESECGGAWRSVDVCGCLHADLGCHLICSDNNLANFMADYGGCNIVSLDQPGSSFAENKGSNGFYFANGCYELVHNLLQMIKRTSIDLLINHTVKSAVVDPIQKSLFVYAGEEIFTTKKMWVTPYIFFPNGGNVQVTKTKYYHLYLLLNDTTPPRFSYGHGIPGVTRMMNLTHFVNLDGTSRQLISLQLHGSNWLDKEEEILTSLKTKNLVDESAYILHSESFIYEQWPSGKLQLTKEQLAYIETLQTHQLSKMTTYIARWKESLPLYNQEVNGLLLEHQD